eukprot:gene272-biopygen4230
MLGGDASTSCPDEMPGREMPSRDAWTRCLNRCFDEMPRRDALTGCLDEMPGRDASTRCLDGMPRRYQTILCDIQLYLT